MGLYKKLRKYLTGRRMAWPPPRREGISLSDINLRDPFIVRDGQGGYLLTGTVYHYNYNDAGMCLCWKSRDLESWSGPFKLIDGEELGGVYYDFWAPEIHFIGGKYHLLITLRPQGGNGVAGLCSFGLGQAAAVFQCPMRLRRRRNSVSFGSFAQEQSFRASILDKRKTEDTWHQNVYHLQLQSGLRILLDLHTLRKSNLKVTSCVLRLWNRTAYSES